jgi:murein DD-endopeptidase MepM/ murein hydrolase activator NlpD
VEVHGNARHAKLSWTCGVPEKSRVKGRNIPEMRIAKKMPKSGVLAMSILALFFAPALIAADAPQCTGGLKLTVSALQASQGTTLIVNVRSAKPLSAITGTWMDRKVYFWPANAGSKARTTSSSAGDSWQALLGVDLEKAPGEYELSISSGEEGGSTRCTATLQIRAGKFATESLKVDPQFVEPNEQQAQRAVAEQQKLRQLYDTVTPEKLWRGPFQIPLTGAVQGTNFGKRRILNGQPRSPHTGADFPAPTGTAVHTTQNGRVVLAEELYFSGNTIIIDHGLGIYSLYGHLSAIDVAVGDDVKAGVVIGKVGATGRVTGPHLHWGVVVNRTRVNPLQLVSILQDPVRSRAPGPRSSRR